MLVGANVSLFVVATGSPPLFYQWRSNNVPLAVTADTTPPAVPTGLAASPDEASWIQTSYLIAEIVEEVAADLGQRDDARGNEKRVQVELAKPPSMTITSQQWSGVSAATLTRQV